MSYEARVSEALAAAEAMTGWDFGWQRDRTHGEELSWSYGDLARAAISKATSLLDLDTGGGELLESLRPLPPHTVATEAWEPNLAPARQRLGPLGVEVRSATDGSWPVADGEFDLVLSRHGAMDAAKTWRALRPGGEFVTQQPGSRNDLELFAALDVPLPHAPDSNTPATAVHSLRTMGFRVLDAREEMPAFFYHDIGAVVFQLTVVSWAIPGFDVHRYDAPLRRLDARIRAQGPLLTHNHRYLITAEKPAG